MTFKGSEADSESVLLCTVQIDTHNNCVQTHLFDAVTRFPASVGSSSTVSPPQVTCHESHSQTGKLQRRLQQQSQSADITSAVILTDSGNLQ